MDGLRVCVSQAWRTRDGHIAHITHIHDPKQDHGIRIAGIVEGDPSSHVWDEHGNAIGKGMGPFGNITSRDGENLDLIEVFKS